MSPGPDLDSILGEKLLSEKNLSVCRNGIAYYDDYMLWDNIELIYIGGTKSSLNSIPTIEDRTITLADSSQKRIYISLTSAFRMKKEKKQLFSDIYSAILNNIASRQWTQFLQKIREGKRLSFQEFEMTQDAFYFHKTFGGWNTVNMTCIRACGIGAGYFYIQYQEPNKKIKTKRVGEVANIPNIHIIQSFINIITQNCSP